MNNSLLELIADAVEAAKAGGMSRGIALDFAAHAIQQTDAEMPYLVARRIAKGLMPDADEVECGIAA
ncbi:hypothetical protein [Paramagnetospirillum magnetotacticum]|nr:hypothetical protein [Paramagnetospirillum magnetotacticum]